MEGHFEAIFFDDLDELLTGEVQSDKAYDLDELYNQVITSDLQCIKNTAKDSTIVQGSTETASSWVETTDRDLTTQPERTIFNHNQLAVVPPSSPFQQGIDNSLNLTYETAVGSTHDTNTVHFYITYPALDQPVQSAVQCSDLYNPVQSAIQCPFLDNPVQSAVQRTVLDNPVQSVVNTSRKRSYAASSYEILRAQNNAACKRYRERARHQQDAADQELTELEARNTRLHRELEARRRELTSLQSVLIQTFMDRQTQAL